MGIDVARTLVLDDVEFVLLIKLEGAQGSLMGLGVGAILLVFGNVASGFGLQAAVAGSVGFAAGEQGGCEEQKQRGNYEFLHDGALDKDQIRAGWEQGYFRVRRGRFTGAEARIRDCSRR